ncbi:uncharacterized protein LOC115888640 [Sitophilus oryzae]|uniref:Uncharacterized protein LOC115888640 n=1 Tax=Sitophilus oryzae TaxID=7048 RepID=A0A6J2YLU0_SITOR|nr:uncharacterized protein LOC115888640 [Sitophilus oryzae]
MRRTDLILKLALEGQDSLSQRNDQEQHFPDFSVPEVSLTPSKITEELAPSINEPSEPPTCLLAEQSPTFSLKTSVQSNGLKLLETVTTPPNRSTSFKSTESVDLPKASTLSASGSSTSSSSSSRSSTCSSSTSSKTDPFMTDEDEEYLLPSQAVIEQESSQSSGSESTQSDQEKEEGPPKKRRKGQISKKKMAKILRDSGKQYISLSKSKKIVAAKKMGPPCTSRCRLKCSEKISENQRANIFQSYWNLASLTRQRDFISGCMKVICPKYQYKMINSNRKSKHAFHFKVNLVETRVCKVFFKNTLGINDRPIRTVIDKINSEGVVEPEMRGKHGKQTKISKDTITGIKKHIELVPRIESHYLRKQTTREFIDGGKNLMDLFRDYKEDCLKEGRQPAQFHSYRKIFKTDYNISFFVPKKDQCELCTSYGIADEKQKLELREKYENHILEKDLSRKEKEDDKKQVKNNFIVSCYDLQAVLPLPKGEVSTFYYKSKINAYNFTITELAKDSCECFVWNEVEGLRGANEIGSCVLRYLKNKSEAVNNGELEIVFYSDNCCGQQKNQFIFSMYMYALANLKIKSITHKFLIAGHTQNENDSVHSVIEKEVKKCLRSGPIYVPEQFIGIIRTARKRGTPYKVNELCYNDFYDLKDLANECGSRFTKNTEGGVVKLSDIKIIKFVKSENAQLQIFYKTSYGDPIFKEINSSAPRSTRQSRKNFQLKKLYTARLELGDRKKHDLKSLIDNSLIPQCYAHSFYNSIID